MTDESVYLIVEPCASTEDLLIKLCDMVNDILVDNRVSIETFNYLLLCYDGSEREDIDFELCRRVLKKIEEDRRNA